MFNLFKKNRILYVANSLVANGGVEGRNLEQILYLRQRGLETEICILRSIGDMADTYQNHGIPVYYFHSYDTGQSQNLKIYPRHLLRFWLFLIRRRYGVIVASQAPSQYLVRLLCFPFSGRRIFVMERTSILNRKPRYRKLDRLLSTWTERIICISQIVADQLQELCKVPSKKITVLEEGYQISTETNPNSVLQKKLQNCFVFGCVSSFSSEKGHKILIRAFASIYPMNHQMRLVLVGDGELRYEIEDLVVNLGLTESVMFTGNVANPHKYYPLFDVFVFPSISEGLGGVFVEACLHKLPVICSDLRPMKDYIRHMQEGLLFTPDDPGDLAKMMRFLYENPKELKIVANDGFERVKTFFDYNRQMAKLYDLLVKN